MSIQSQNHQFCQFTIFASKFTSHFRAPEFWSGEKYDREVVAFSFSGFLYELLTEKKKKHLEGQSQIIIDQMIANKDRLILPDNISTDLRNLIDSCLKQNQFLYIRKTSTKCSRR